MQDFVIEKVQIRQKLHFNWEKGLTVTRGLGIGDFTVKQL